jgi:K+-sensing histidine kinase KdpD
LNIANTESDPLDLLKGAVHAIRSPASSIWDLADTVVATKRETLDEQTRTDIAQIQDLAQQVLTTADAIAMLIRVEVVQPSLVSANLPDVVAEAVRRYNTTPNAVRQAVNAKLPLDLPLVNVDYEWIVQSTLLLFAHCSRNIAQSAEINLSACANGGLVIVTISAEHRGDVSHQGISDLELLTVDRTLARHGGKFWIEKRTDQIIGYGYSLPASGT